MNKEASTAGDHNWELVPTDPALETLAVQNSGKVTVGRQEGCDLVIPDPYISRQHASLEVRDGCLYLRDLDSTQGIFVNDEKTSERQLQHGDEVRLEQYSFKVHQLDFNEPDVSVVDDGATVIRKAPDLAEAGTMFQEQPAATEPDATGPARAPAGSGPDIAKSPVPDADAGRPAEAQPSSSPPEPSPPAMEAEKDKDDSQSASTPGKGNWWENQGEGPKGTQMFQAGDFQLPDPAAPRADIVADGPMLVGLTKPIEGQEFRLQDGNYILGRGDAADIRIADDTVSDKHAQIVGDGVSWQVVNLISANGTFVNGKNVRTAVLVPGDVVRMGGIELQFVDSEISGRSSKGPGGILSSKWFMPVLLLVAAIVAGLAGLSFFGFI